MKDIANPDLGGSPPRQIRLAQDITTAGARSVAADQRTFSKIVNGTPFSNATLINVCYGIVIKSLYLESQNIESPWCEIFYIGLATIPEIFRNKNFWSRFFLVFVIVREKKCNRVTGKACSDWWYANWPDSFVIHFQRGLWTSSSRNYAVPFVRKTRASRVRTCIIEHSISLLYMQI